MFMCSCILGEPSIEDYFKVFLESDKIGDQIQETVLQSRAAQQSLVSGRVVIVRNSVVSCSYSSCRLNFVAKR